MHALSSSLDAISHDRKEVVDEGRHLVGLVRAAREEAAQRPLELHEHAPRGELHRCVAEVDEAVGDVLEVQVLREGLREGRLLGGALLEHLPFVGGEGPGWGPLACTRWRGDRWGEHFSSNFCQSSTSEIHGRYMGDTLGGRCMHLLPELDAAAAIVDEGAQVDEAERAPVVAHLHAHGR